jgi:hypothetical protein
MKQRLVASLTGKEGLTQEQLFETLLRADNKEFLIESFNGLFDNTNQDQDQDNTNGFNRLVSAMEQRFVVVSMT